MSKHVITIGRIDYEEYAKAHNEVREHVALKLFANVFSGDDLEKNISNLPSIQKDFAFQKVSETYSALDELCQLKGYCAAYLKGRETEVHIRNKMQVSNINIRDLFIIVAMCNKVATIMANDVDEYDICTLLATLDEIVEKPTSLKIEDSDPWI